MPDYSNIASCSIGGSSFQLSDWGLSSEPVRNEDGLVMGRRLVITGEGWVEGTNAADFAAKVLAATAAFSVQGVNVIIKGLGGNVEAELLAARCVDFGPVVSVTVLPQGGGTALRKTFQFVAEGETAPAADEGSTGSVRRTQRKSITERPDGLLRVRMTGELIGPDAGLNYDTLLAETRADYPWPRWTVSEDTHEQNASGDKVSYAVVAEQLSDDLVEVADTRAVDGSYSESVEQDEHNRIMRVYTWDLLVEGNPWALEPVLQIGRAHV